MSASSLNLSESFTKTKKNSTELCEKILRLFDGSKDVIQAGRNTLKLITLDNDQCVIKAFRVPTFPQNYSYGLISKSKAEKSFRNATKLINLGFLSPKPIGYFEYRSQGKMLNSYYLCKFEEGSQTLADMLDADPTLDDDLIQQFAEYSFNLHDKGVLHRDFNPNNILISQVDSKYSFSLVDINRITWFKKLSLQQSMQSLARLPLDDEVIDKLLHHYASKAQVNLDQCHSLLNQSRVKTQRYFRNKKRFRKIFPKRKK